MVLVQRDNFDNRCLILERNISRTELPSYLEALKVKYEAQGWKAFWDNEAFKYSLIVTRGEFECFTFCPYFKRVPSRKDWFVW